MSIVITLEAARVNAGYLIKEASVLFGVHAQTLSSYEMDSSKVPFSFINQVPDIYKIPTSHIFFGDKYEFIRTLREQNKPQEVK